jgi:hypothetical protein
MSSFVTTVGTDQTMSMPLLDAETGGITRLISGPDYRRNSLRYFLRMPDKDEAEKLPCPMGFDRNSITFEPYLIVAPNPIPDCVTAQFYRITGPEGRGKIGKRKIHLWQSQIDTGIYPCHPIQIHSLRPGQTMEIEGNSFWFNPRRTRRAGQVYVAASPEWSPAPPIKTFVPFQLLVMVKMKWLPKNVAKGHTEYVHGSPLQAPAPAPPPIHGDIQLDDFKPSPGWRSTEPA